MDHNGLIPQLIDIAKKSESEILSIYDSAELGVEYKADASPLTRADKASNSVINKWLSRITPGIPVISEEDSAVPYEKRKNWERFWLVDPLDGTREFIKRNGEFTVNIALIERGAPVLGLVSVPCQDRVYYGSTGGGAFRISGGGRPIPVKAGAGPHAGSGLTAAVSRSHLSDKADALLERLGAKAVGAGSALKFAMVAEGKADLYPRLGPTWEWDTGAGHAVAEAAGAVVCGLDGEPLRYNKEVLKHPGFLVCSPQAKEQAIEAVSLILAE